MFVAWAFSLMYDVVATFHNIPNDALLSFVDGDDADLPIVLD
jgi:hypothetical protein